MFVRLNDWKNIHFWKSKCFSYLTVFFFTLSRVQFYRMQLTPEDFRLARLFRDFEQRFKYVFHGILHSDVMQFQTIYSSKIQPKVKQNFQSEKTNKIYFIILIIFNKWVFWRTTAFDQKIESFNEWFID